jgi:cysteine synthase A
MKTEGATGSLVTLICDSGERYGHTYYNDDWVAAQGFKLAPHEQALDVFLDGKGAGLS